jgi:tryptophan synthase
VTFVTAGYPSPNDTVSIMLAMEAGGADIIELGVPFSDPVADGIAIQKTNAARFRFAYNAELKLILNIRSQLNTMSTTPPFLAS